MNENELPAGLRTTIEDALRLVRPYERLAQIAKAEIDAARPPDREVIAVRQEHDDLPDLKTIMVEAIREASAESTPKEKKRTKPDKPATVNECMAGMLSEDTSRIGWSASEWAVVVSDRLKRKVSAAAVKQTDTWKKQIILGRVLMKADTVDRRRTLLPKPDGRRNKGKP